MNQAFEAWLTSLEKPVAGMHTGKLNEYRTQMCKEVWQAASQHYEAKLAEMQAELEFIKQTIGLSIATHLRSGQGLAVQCVFSDYKDAEKFKALIDSARL